MCRVEKRAGRKKKPWAGVEAVDPFELTSMNVCELTARAENGPLGNRDV